MVSPVKLSIWVLLWIAVVPASAQTAGVVELLEGRVLIIDAKNRMQRIKPDDEIQEGQTIITGGDGELHLRMIDGAMIAVRPNTKLRINRYRAEGEEDDGAFFELLKGAMRSITGWIGQTRKDRYRIQTTTATIGVRGTDHETMVVERNAAARKLFGEPGTYDKVNDGSTILKNQFGSTILEKNQAGFVGFGDKAPRRLDEVPDFFKPTRHDRRIDERKIELRRRLQEATPLRPPRPGGAGPTQGPEVPKPGGAVAPQSLKKPDLNRPQVAPSQRKVIVRPQSAKQPRAPGGALQPKPLLPKSPLPEKSSDVELPATGTLQTPMRVPESGSPETTNVMKPPPDSTSPESTLLPAITPDEQDSGGDQLRSVQPLKTPDSTSSDSMSSPLLRDPTRELKTR